MEKKPFERPYIKKLSAGMPSKFGMPVRIDAISSIDEYPVEDLIEKFGSPLYVISEKNIRETMARAKQAFATRYPKVQFAWSYKTNYLNAVCRVFHQEGSWAEVVSRFEYDKALHNGVNGSQIIFNGPDKTDDDLECAIHNDSFIHIDHFDEMYAIIDIAGKLNKKPKVAIRVNMDTGVFPMWDRFGFNYENGEAWDAINRIMINEKLELAGLHTHIGTYMLSANAYKVAMAKLADLAFRLEKKFGVNLKYIDIGGGFASKNTLKGAYLPGKDTVPTFDEYAEAITSALLNSEINPRKLPVLILETGRALIDDAGYLVGTVIANKRLSDGRRATIVDIGVNLMFTSFWYEHEIHPAKSSSEHLEESTIYGPLCMNIDVLREAIAFPILKKGDHFVIKRIGAYNMSQWMQFITLRPNVVLIDINGNDHIIRKAEKLEDIIASEKIPDHLA
ncbi:MAG: diaminopimelate decarboxylase [Bacteroides sp. SM23_62_1]|nr:MAG: diaminopimelate decarboxylase [Bacteroides sp. SM23_62_1]